MVVDVEMVKCPFNPHHVLKKLRLPQHIAKCRLHNPDYVRCRFDATHYALREEIIEHERNCPERYCLNPTYSSAYSPYAHKL